MGDTSGSIVSRQGAALSGTAVMPGDKSISHRALIFSALADGASEISGLLDGDDVLRTAAAMRALGVEVERTGSVWRVQGGPWGNPDRALYFGNSGTGVRLVMGAVAGVGRAVTFEGDASLRARPMGRVLEPLRMMGLEAADTGGRLPVRFNACSELSAINCKLVTPSAQVKSAILLAALGAKGSTRIHESVLCRDHTERMLGVFGVSLTFEGDGSVGRYITLEGGQKLRSANIVVPGDPSSAAFLVAAALITPGSEITVKNVLINPLRMGFYETLRDMGASIKIQNRRTESGEIVADICARHSELQGVEVSALRAPTMIDEYPILSVVAAYASGDTMMMGVEELRLKESDRIASIEAGLVACSVEVASGQDWLRVRGKHKVKGGGRVKTNNDHRIAMSFLVMGLASEEPVEIDDGAMIATSFPDFTSILRSFGAVITF